jgi:hypothetical protein
MSEVRKGQAPAVLSREAFHERFMQSFVDPAFRAEDEALARLEALAWDAYKEGRKAPLTRKAGAGFADPGYDLSTEWLETRARIQKAQAEWNKPATPSRVLLIAAQPATTAPAPARSPRPGACSSSPKPCSKAPAWTPTCWT